MTAYEYRQMNKKGTVGQVVTNTPLALRIKYVGGGSVTSVTNTANTNLVLIATNAAGTSSTVTCTYSTDNTVGKVADRINASPLWEAKVLDCLRTMTTDSSELGVDTGALSVSTFEGVSYYDIHLDTSVSLEFGYRLTYDRHVGAEKPKGAHRVILQEVKYAITMGAAAADSMQIYECNGSTETKLIGSLSVQTTATTVNWASGLGYITANDGNDIFVRVKDATTLADDTGNYLDVVGFKE